MFMHSLQKSTRQAVRAKGLARHTVLTILHKELNYRSWKLRLVEELKPEDCDCNMEYGELILG